MKEFWKNTGKILGKILGTTVEWAWYLVCIAGIGLMAKATWVCLRFGWRVLP